MVTTRHSRRKVARHPVWMFEFGTLYGSRSLRSPLPPPLASCRSTTTMHHLVSSPFLHSSPVSLILLNGPTVSTTLLNLAWQRSHYRVCADGGANRLYGWDPTLVPDAIRGDLDSLKGDIKAYYQSRGVEIERIADQDSNDLEKCLSRLPDASNVVILGAFGGRLDQEMAALHALYQYPASQIWLYSDETCAVLLKGGEKHTIELSTDGPLREGPTCGLIPLGKPCESVTTTGLQWNLNNDRMEFGGLVSSSNCIVSSPLTVEASDDLLFTAQVHVVTK